MTDITFSSADYPEIRNRSILLNTKIYNSLSSEDIKTCGCDLEVWGKTELAIDNETDMNLFADYAIYAYCPNGFNMAEKFLRFSHQEADEYELELLRYMRSAHYAMYQVEETNGIDTFNAVDLFSQVKYTIIDYILAKSTHQGQILAGYLIDFEGFSIQTGRSIIMAPELLQSGALKQVIDFMKVTYPGGFLSNPDIGALLAKQMVSSALKIGKPSNVARVKF